MLHNVQNITKFSSITVVCLTSVHTYVVVPVGVGIFLTVVDTVSAVVHMQLTSVAARKEYAFKRDGQLVLYT